jgi:hypothetical protein
MGVAIAVVLALAAFCAYVYACLWVLTHVTVPLVLLAAAAGAGGGLIAALAATLLALSGRADAAIRTPDDVLAGALRGRSDGHLPRPDHAWPQYFVAQVRLDLRAAWDLVATVVLRSWTGPIRLLRQVDYRALLVFWPLLLPVAVAIVALDAAAFVGFAAVLAVCATICALAWAAGCVVVGALRGLDRVWQLLVRAGGSCPRCYEVSALPAYQCTGPHPAADPHHGLHRDLRPGRLGVLWRRCACGTRLPTTVLRAAWRLPARCPLCGEPLHRGAAVHTDVRVPVFGAASAGKTHLIMGTLVNLMRATGPPGVELKLADERSAHTYQGHLAVFDSGGSAPKTDASALPVALTLLLHNRRRRAMVHLFDAAGEALADPDLNAQLAYLDRARTLIFVLDPFSIPELQQRYAGGHGQVFRRANAARDWPEASYQATVTRLRDHSVDTGRQRLAFVVTKRDLLAELPPAASPAPGSDAVRAWLCELGLDNLVTSAERDFGAVQYFLVAVRHGDAGATATQPLRWLVAGEKLALPAVNGG